MRFGHVIKKWDLKYQRILQSVDQKMLIHNYFLSQIDKYSKIVEEEMNQWDGKGIKSTENHIKLSAYFEALLNNAYSIMENIAMIIQPFFKGEKIPPNGFNAQLNWFDKHKNVDKIYSDYLSKNLDWYSKLNEARSEPVHFQSGLIVFEKDENRLYKSKYFNDITSEREKTVFKENKINLELNFSRELQKNIDEFLEFCAKYFLSKINPEEEAIIYDLKVDKETGQVSITPKKLKLNDFLSGKIEFQEIQI